MQRIDTAQILREIFKTLDLSESSAIRVCVGRRGGGGARHDQFGQIISCETFTQRLIMQSNCLSGPINLFEITNTRSIRCLGFLNVNKLT